MCNQLVLFFLFIQWRLKDCRSQGSLQINLHWVVLVKMLRFCRVRVAGLAWLTTYATAPLRRGQEKWLTSSHSFKRKKRPSANYRATTNLSWVLLFVSSTSQRWSAVLQPLPASSLQNLASFPRIRVQHLASQDRIQHSAAWSKETAALPFRMLQCHPVRLQSTLQRNSSARLAVPWATPLLGLVQKFPSVSVDILWCFNRQPCPTTASQSWII